MNHSRSTHIQQLSDEPDGNGHPQLEMRNLMIANRTKNNFILATTDPKQDQGVTRYYSSDGRNDSWCDDPIHAYRMNRETAERMANRFNRGEESDRVFCEVKRLEISVVSVENNGDTDD